VTRVTFTFTMTFPDEYSEQECITSACEVVGQDSNWPSDDEIKIEYNLPEEPND
jgi:hypothetical protein